MERILLVDPEPNTDSVLAPALRKTGYQVRTANTGRDAIRMKLNFFPDIILLDWMLPDMHGLEACKQLRQTCTTPIILLTKRSEKTAPLRGLELCADDTLTKPFSTREALAHIQAVLRRVRLDRQGTEFYPIRRGVFFLDPAAHRVLKNERDLQLSIREFDLLCVLLDNAGQALSRTEIMARVWGSQWIGDPRTLDVHIRWLRLKIEDDPANPVFLQTVHGFGYRFNSLEG